MGARRPVSRGRHSAAAVADRIHKTARTVRSYVAEPRAEYEARSVERAKPWLREGISRRTWYRRKNKRMPS
jgi:hypothetical protein